MCQILIGPLTLAKVSFDAHLIAVHFGLGEKVSKKFQYFQAAHCVWGGGKILHCHRGRDIGLGCGVAEKGPCH